MEEKTSKGFSLRKKRNGRPAISAPKPQVIPPPKAAAAQAISQQPSLDSSQLRPINNEKTSDLVKRRYSSRFVNLPPGFDPTAPPVPSLPSAVGQRGPDGSTGQQPSGSRDVANRPPPKLDMDALRDPALQADSYVANVLVHASEAEIVEYQSSLQKIRNRTSTDLQQNVYQNRTQFVRISKEAEKLKGEMRTLRNLMSELRANTNELSQESLGKTLPDSGPHTARRESAATAARKHANRSSIANLEAMWNSQLQSLWKNVEGSQKFLPAVPGRHVVRDSPHWVELNAATWKARRAIHIFLLNDHLLIASRKRKRLDASDPTSNLMNDNPQPVLSKLVAERCWPLQDLEMIDLSSKARSRGTGDGLAEQDGASRAINIRVGQESYTYRHDRADGNETMGLLLAFRKAADDLSRSARAEVSDHLTMRGRGDASGAWTTASSSSKPRHSESGSALPIRDRASISIEVDGKQQNMRWVEAQIDELDIALALQRFSDAVDGVEKLRKVAKGSKGNAAVQERITGQTDERANKLATVLLRQLVETHSFLKMTQRNVTWLTRIGFEDRAREVYLEARSAVVNKRARQFIFEGNLPLYIFQLAFVYFTIIKNTVSVFQSCFPALMMSACVKWAKDEAERFNQVLTRQMSTIDPGSEVWQECMDHVREHAMLLTEVGLDFRNLVTGVRTSSEMQESVGVARSRG